MMDSMTLLVVMVGAFFGVFTVAAIGLGIMFLRRLRSLPFGAASSGVHAVGGAPSYGSADESGDDDDDDEELEDPPPTTKGLPVITAQARACAGCKFFDLPAGARELARNPTFARVMAHKAPWQMGWQFTPEYLQAERVVAEKGAEYRQAEQAIAAFKAQHPDDAITLAVMQNNLMALEQKIEKLKVELEKLPKYLKGGEQDAGVKASMKLGWEDFGLCVEHAELRARVDSCPKWAVREGA